MHVYALLPDRSWVQLQPLVTSSERRSPCLVVPYRSVQRRSELPRGYFEVVRSPTFAAPTNAPPEFAPPTFAALASTGLLRRSQESRFALVWQVERTTWRATHHSSRRLLVPPGGAHHHYLYLPLPTSGRPYRC
jgi:hypothetical protein